MILLNHYVRIGEANVPPNIMDWGDTRFVEMRGGWRKYTQKIGWWLICR